MIEIYLEGQSEKLAATNPRNLKHPPLYHQQRTAEALQQYPLVVNAHNTGTGKTVASLLHLFELKGGPNDNVLFIAPTNELLHQHFEDVQAFVDEHELPFHVVEINAALLRKLSAEDSVSRSGKSFVQLIRNPLEYYGMLGIDAANHQKNPLILVTNPDLFYYAFYWQFAAHDQRNLFQSFAQAFRYVIIDEFHYYNTKQMANFLFFILLSEEWGYFDEQEGRRLCLLSATPDANTRTYLNRILGEGRWQEISPETEPAEAATLETTPVLAPLTLHVRSETFEEFAKNEGATLRQWLAEGEHGALISSSLRQINQAFYTLRPHLKEARMGRITGAQPIEARRADQFKDLILATPTVDIGYNFKKQEKARQNLDFVVFDARFQDEFLQRLGRVGRVLGKSALDTPSRAIALVSREASGALEEMAGQRLSRSAFSTLLKHTTALPQKDDFAAYLRNGGLAENAYPLYRLREMFAKRDHDQLETLFDTVRTVFAPNSKRSYKDIVKQFSRLRDITGWLHEPMNSYYHSKLPNIVADFMEWLDGARPDPSDMKDHLADLLENEDFKQSFLHYCEAQQALMQTQFSFRDSFSGPEAWIFDPAHLLSAADVTRYDLIHVIQNYDYRPVGREAMQRVSDEPLPEQALCVQLHNHRQQRVQVALRWTPPKLRYNDWSLVDFQRCYVSGDPIALYGLKLKADEPITLEIREAIQDKYITALLVPDPLCGLLFKETRFRQIYSRDLFVDLNGKETQYQVLLGTAALLMSPLLKWAFQKWEKEGDEAIVL